MLAVPPSLRWSSHPPTSSSLSARRSAKARTGPCVDHWSCQRAIVARTPASVDRRGTSRSAWPALRPHQPDGCPRLRAEMHRARPWRRSTWARPRTIAAPHRRATRPPWLRRSLRSKRIAAWHTRSPFRFADEPPHFPRLPQPAEVHDPGPSRGVAAARPSPLTR